MALTLQNLHTINDNTDYYIYEYDGICSSPARFKCRTVCAVEIEILQVIIGNND